MEKFFNFKKILKPIECDEKREKTNWKRQMQTAN